MQDCVPSFPDFLLCTVAFRRLRNSGFYGEKHTVHFIQTTLRIPYLEISIHHIEISRYDRRVMGRVCNRAGPVGLARGPVRIFFWSTHAGAELDLLVVRGRARLGFEIKRTTALRVTPSMRHALADLKLKRLDVIHAGDTTFPLAKNIRAVALSRLLTDIKPLAT